MEKNKLKESSKQNLKFVLHRYSLQIADAYIFAEQLYILNLRRERNMDENVLSSMNRKSQYEKVVTVNLRDRDEPFTVLSDVQCQ